MVYFIRAVLAVGAHCADTFSIVWLLSLPLRLIGMSLDAAFALLKTLLFLPARLFGYRGRA
jgi:hypothetical protein